MSRYVGEDPGGLRQPEMKLPEGQDHCAGVSAGVFTGVFTMVVLTVAVAVGVRAGLTVTLALVAGVSDPSVAVSV